MLGTYLDICLDLFFGLVLGCSMPVTMDEQVFLIRQNKLTPECFESWFATHSKLFVAGLRIVIRESYDC